ncbi:MAG: response regulator [Candidatus Sumerlaeia bacterium]
MSNQTEIKSRTILIVDDDEDFRLQLKLQLEADGHSVFEAENPAEAEEALKDRKADLAIVDLMMDEMDAGFTLCYHLKKNYPDMPVIMATAVASEAGLGFDTATDEERSWVKADALLNKPIRPEQLRKEMLRLLKD